MIAAVGPEVSTTIEPDARTLAYRLFRALPDSVTGLRLLHLMAHPPRILWPRHVRIMYHRIPSRAPNQTVPVWVLRPEGARRNLPIILHLHGGGYAVGTPQQDFSMLASLMSVSPCVFVVPAYRRSLQSPYPAALEDAAAALQWVARFAEGLDADRSRIFVMGMSAGGGLAASLCQWALDLQIVKVSGQYLIGAMLDDLTRPVLTCEPLELSRPEWSWSVKRNRLAWDLYLSGTKTEAHQLGAVAARRENLAGLPRAYGLVGAADLFHDENSAYFARLARDGVSSSLSVVPNAYHGIEVLAPKSVAGRRFVSALKSGFEQMVSGDTAIVSPETQRLQ